MCDATKRNLAGCETHRQEFKENFQDMCTTPTVTCYNILKACLDDIAKLLESHYRINSGMLESIMFFLVSMDHQLI